MLVAPVNMFCAKCNDPVTDFVPCCQCDGKFHFGCAGVSESSYRRMGQEKKAAWRCVTCRSQNTESGSGVMAEVLKEIKSLRIDFNAMKTDFNVVQSDIRSTKESLQDLNSKWDEMEARFSGIEDRLIVAEGRLTSFSGVSKELAQAQETILDLKSQNNAQDQFSRQNNVEISGIPATSGENLNSLLNTLCTVVGFKLSDTDVDTIHRVRPYRSESELDGQPSRHPSIVVRFTQRRRKEQLIAAVRSRRGLTTVDIGMPGRSSNLYVSDHLTPINKLLLKRVRALKVEKNYTYVWVKDCKILIRKNDSSNIIRIVKESDLYKIK